MGPRLTPYRPATSAVVSTGPRPGDHTIRTEPRDRFEHAQRRPGPRPRRHSPTGLGHHLHSGRSTKAGAETPATHDGFCAAWLHWRAQRRPGPRPRRHKPSCPLLRGPVHEPIAQRRPGPRPRRHYSMVEIAAYVLDHAQRRPGPRPRRHSHIAIALDQQPSRSTKAGAETPATPTIDLVLVHRGQSRSTKAGAETPATPTMTLCWSTAVKVAQRRPGPRPRRHRFVEVDDRLPRRRSTKAGAETPATHPSPDPYTAHVVRSTKAGAETPATRAPCRPRMRTIFSNAQRRPGPRPRRHTMLVSRPCHDTSGPLNEGRGRDPGDTSSG